MCLSLHCLNQPYDLLRGPYPPSTFNPSTPAIPQARNVYLLCSGFIAGLLYPTSLESCIRSPQITVSGPPGLRYPAPQGSCLLPPGGVMCQAWPPGGHHPPGRGHPTTITFRFRVRSMERQAKRRGRVAQINPEAGSTSRPPPTHLPPITHQQPPTTHPVASQLPPSHHPPAAHPLASHLPPTSYHTHTHLPPTN